MRLAATALLLITIVATSVAVAAARSSDETRRACRPHGSKTLVESRQARVYRDKFRGAQFAFGCFYSEGREWDLDDPPGQTSLFRPPAIALAGSLVGFGMTAAGDQYIDIVDLRHGGGPPGKGRVPQLLSTNTRAVRVGSVALRPNGAIAWITCPSDDNGSWDQEPNCVRPGARNRVFRLNSNRTKLRLLDRGRGIDPSSLRRSGGKIRWTKRNRHKAALLR